VHHVEKFSEDLIFVRREFQCPGALHIER